MIIADTFRSQSLAGESANIITACNGFGIKDQPASELFNWPQAYRGGYQSSISFRCQQSDQTAMVMTKQILESTLPLG